MTNGRWQRSLSKDILSSSLFYTDKICVDVVFGSSSKQNATVIVCCVCQEQSSVNNRRLDYQQMLRKRHASNSEKEGNTYTV